MHKSARRSHVFFGIVAVGVAAIFAIVLWVIFGGRAESEKEDSAPKKNAVQKVISPAEKKVEAKTAEEKVAKDVIIWRGKEYPLYDAKGGKAYITGYGVRYHTPRVITNTASAQVAIPWEAKPFKHSTDRMIAILLNTEPGQMFVGEFKYDKDFNKRFKKSLETPITIEDGDLEHIRLIKEAVIETRKDLKERMDNGEDIGQVIFDTQKEFQELGAYKHELTRLLEKLSRQKDMTEKDMDDYVRAANDMLESRGCSKLTMPELMRRSVRMREKMLKTKNSTVSKQGDVE